MMMRKEHTHDTTNSNVAATVRRTIKPWGIYFQVPLTQRDIDICQSSITKECTIAITPNNVLLGHLYALRL